MKLSFLLIATITIGLLGIVESNPQSYYCLIVSSSLGKEYVQISTKAESLEEAVETAENIRQNLVIGNMVPKNTEVTCKKEE